MNLDCPATHRTGRTVRTSTLCSARPRATRSAGVRPCELRSATSPCSVLLTRESCDVDRGHDESDAQALIAVELGAREFGLTATGRVSGASACGRSPTEGLQGSWTLPKSLRRNSGRPEQPSQDVEQVSRKGRADRDVAHSHRLDQVLGLCDDAWQIHAEEVDPSARAMFDDVADASIHPARQSVETTKRLGSVMSSLLTRRRVRWSWLGGGESLAADVAAKITGLADGTARRWR